MLRGFLWLALLFALVAIAVSVGVERTQLEERLDAERQREAIRAVEVVLYRTSPPELGDGDRVADALTRLAEELAPPDAPYRARRRALRLYELIALASGMDDVGYALPDLDLLRAEWEKQRDSLFAPAPWFGRSGAVDAQTKRPAIVDPRDVTRLRHTVRRLEQLANAGEQEARELGEPAYDSAAPGAAGRVQIERWNAWARRWNERIDDALRELPPPPPFDAELALVLAHQNTSRAAHELRLVPIGVGDWQTPFQYSWESRFRAARDLLEEQRAALASAPD
ncbi:MAG: hypothetical protein WEF50_18150 [Myxococcota bacterium]